METIRITFETITPLWTGDAWGENLEIRPSSLMGSLRFWFEVICYFAGITNEKDYENGKLRAELNYEKFSKLIQNYVNNGKLNDFTTMDTALAESGIPFPARIFGCTGWKGWVRVKKIDYEKDNLTDKPSGRIIQKKNWFWKSPSYQGKFYVDFEVEEEILNPVFVPLLSFMKQYGFWGGAWNIGFGRLNWTSEQIESKSREFKFSKFKFNQENDSSDTDIDDLLEKNTNLNSESKSFDLVNFFLGAEKFYCATEREFQNKTENMPKKIKLIENLTRSASLIDVVSDLLKLKAAIRNCLRHESENQLQLKLCFKDNKFKENKKLNYEINNSKRFIQCGLLKNWIQFRHTLLGATVDGAEGTKIIPWIAKENGEFKGGLISIAGLLNLEGKNGTK